MKSLRRRSRLPAILVGGLLALAGCKDIFVPKLSVAVDAIAAPGVAKLNGQSFKLVGKRSVVVSQRQVDVATVAACVKAALIQQGMFEAPDNVPPDVFIEVNYGQEAPTRANLGTRESYLQLSARTNPERALERTRGPEIWDVRAAMTGLGGRFEDAVPLLATMAAGAAGTDTQVSTTKKVPQNSPAVAAVREAANKEIIEKAAAAKPPGAAPTPAPAAPPTK
jgi:hypothetical protein